MDSSLLAINRSATCFQANSSGFSLRAGINNESGRFEFGIQHVSAEIEMRTPTEVIWVGEGEEVRKATSVQIGQSPRRIRKRDWQDKHVRRSLSIDCRSSKGKANSPKLNRLLGDVVGQIMIDRKTAINLLESNGLSNLMRHYEGR